ncbi:NUDIX domain-containing protein [Euzebya sp.]|uniref:NUDIX domain-containing protein n=1 Tax=Euzebya sp. TaxID=1971409 RepID=UPI003511C52E
MELSGTTGPHGAAGLLLTAEGPEPRMLLVLRSAAVTHPHTWSVPAGSLASGEHPIEGAIREAEEELGGLPDFDVLGTVTDAVTATWSFHTVIARVEAATPVVASGVDAWELASTRWVTASSATRLPLHPRLRACWPRLMEVVARRHHQFALLRL